MAASSLKHGIAITGTSRSIGLLLIPRINFSLHPALLRTRPSCSFLDRKWSSSYLPAQNLGIRQYMIPNYCLYNRKPSLIPDVFSISDLSRHYSTQQNNPEPEKKPTLLQRFKQMYRDYWYVLVPVHAATSLAWFGGFYYLLQSGVDVIAILEHMDVSETLLKPLRDSKAGYLAISYALYKIATPLRYTVTLGGTTISINYLQKWGYIRPKPIPTRDKLKEMYQERKDNLRERRDNLMESVRETKAEFKERKDNIMESVRETAGEIKTQSDQLKDRAAHTSPVAEGNKREAK